MLIDIHNRADKYIYNKLLITTLIGIDNSYISVLNVFKASTTNSYFKKLSNYFQYDTNTINIENTDIKKYITNMNKYAQDSEITLAIHFDDNAYTVIKNEIITIHNNNIMEVFNTYFENYFENNNIIFFLIFLYIIIHYDNSIIDTFKTDLQYIILFLILFEQSYQSVGINISKHLTYYTTNFEIIQDETKILLDKLKLELTEYSYIHKMFDYIMKLFPILKKKIITFVQKLHDPELNNILTPFISSGQTGGNKVIKDNNIIDIKNTYDLYYSTNTDDLIIELLDVLGTNENVIYFLLIINTSLANFFEDLNQILIDFYNSDILLSYYYNDNEIIYYIFLNYIYNNYKSLLSLSTKDIIINIGKIKTKENYNEIYKILEELFKNPEIISKLIIFIKSHLKIPETIRHPKKIKDVEYILLFIYKYSKKDEKVIKGYDSFLTYIYLNLLNKFNITSKIKIDDLPTFNLYNFTNLRKTYYFELSSNQDQLCVKLMKDVKLLISIISDRYKYIENKKYIKSINGFILNDEILDYLNIFETHEIFSDYKQMPIMDLYILNKNSKIDIRDIREPSKQDNIIYNILLLSSFIYKNNNKISVEIYCKLVKHYFLIKNNNKLNDLTYKFIYLMNKRINRLDIQRKLINELSSFNIELSEIKKFVEPEDIKIDILELLEKINLITYLKSNIELMIPYLLEFYKNDNKTQYSIQDLLSKQILTEKPYKLLMYGGTSSTTDTVKSDPIVYEKKTELINTTFADITTDELEKNNKKINKTINEIKKLSEIETEFNNALKFTIEVDKKKIEITKYDDYMDMNGKFDDLSKTLIDHCTNKDKETSPQSPESMRYKSLLNNKLIEIEKFKTKIINTYENDINNAQTAINKYYEPYEKMIDKIKEKTEIQDYPYIKEIYKLYIKVDEEKAKLKYDIDEYFKEYIEQLKELQSYLDDIIEPSNNKGKIPNLIKNLDDLITNNKQQRYNNNKNRNGFPDFGGGGRFDKKIVGGGVNIADKINKLEEKLKTRIQEREKKMDTISKNFKKLKENRKIDNDVEKKLATPDLFDKDGNNIFERLINSYEQDINDKTIPPEIANNLFYNKVKQNNLDPEIELDITLNDKLIFIAVVYCIRFGSLLFCEYLIKHNKITDINKSLFYFLVFYYVIFGSLLLLINIDTFKLRILVNYMNLHISTTNIWMHLILMGSFVYLIYLLVMNILGDEKPPTELGDHEKIKLKYKLDLLTIIIYVFICILIFII
jgi:hypothetical protein